MTTGLMAWQVQIWKFLFIIIVSMYGEGQERGPTVSVYSHLLNTVDTLLWFGAPFKLVVLCILSKLM